MQPFAYEGLVFRAFQDSDADEFASAARESADTVGRWMPWCTAEFSAANALDWFQQCRNSRHAQSGNEFGVFSEDSGLLLGGAGLNAINHQNLFCNLGYWVRQSAQRRQVALRTVQALAPYAFDTLGMQRVEIVIATGNTASQAVARKVGALYECTARNRLQLHGGPVAAEIYSLIP